MDEIHAHKNPSYKCNELEELIDRAIKDELCIVFENIKTEKCKYIQKVAEARSSWLGVQLNAIFFVAAFGFGLATVLNFIDYKYLM